VKWPYVDFIGKRKVFFVISTVLVLVSIGSLIFRGLNFSIEFQGGTVITLANAKGATISQVRTAASSAGVTDAQVQTTSNGFIVRSAETSTTVSERQAAAIGTTLNVASTDRQVSTIGPEWGASVTNSALLALTVSIIAILAYVSIRFEYKMAVTGVLALFHDAIITLGIYSLVGREVSPNTIAALLTILGYSLYDTIVVFHRIRENSQTLSKKTFLQMANDSLNQVLARWVNTGLASIIPVVALLLLGGTTLKDFAFALTIGLVSGAYSSVALAAPLYAMWKEREPRYRALAKKFAGATK
jgi:SecD/SecF fusion protein